MLKWQATASQTAKTGDWVASKSHGSDKQKWKLQQNPQLCGVDHCSNVHQCVLGPKWMLVLNFKKSWGGTMTFCHRYYWSVEESNVCCDASKMRALQWALTTKMLCAPRSTCNEYVRTSKDGRGLPNIAECFFRWFQSSWAMRSWDLHPQIEANSKMVCEYMCQDVKLWAIS